MYTCQVQHLMFYSFMLMFESGLGRGIATGQVWNGLKALKSYMKFMKMSNLKV